MAGEMTQRQRELLGAIRDGDLTGWHTTIMRLHASWSADAHQLRGLGLLTWLDHTSPLRVTDAGLTALQHKDAPNG